MIRGFDDGEEKETVYNARYQNPDIKINYDNNNDDEPALERTEDKNS